MIRSAPRVTIRESYHANDYKSLVDMNDYKRACTLAHLPKAESHAASKLREFTPAKFVHSHPKSELGLSLSGVPFTG